MSRYKVKGTGTPGFYNLMWNRAKGCKMEVVGQVFKEGSKWRAEGMDNKFGSKKIAVAAATGRHILAGMKAATEDLAHAADVTAGAVGELNEALGLLWPEWAEWPKGTILRHKESGMKGPLETAKFQHKKRQYTIRVHKAKLSSSSVVAVAAKFEEVTG